jgi:hypothetical protein
MILEDQTKAFKAILGSHYTSKVQEVLEKEGVKDTSGKTHSRKMITQVFNGETSHALIEDAIVKCVASINKLKIKQDSKKKNLLKTIS